MFNKLKPKLLIYIIWLQALAATLGSLYFSEIANFPPCKLCWYQRIFIYPLVFILPIAIIKKSQNIALYILSLTIPGALIALYHNLLYYGFLEESQATCELGISCTTKYVTYFGFITIPLLSLTAFLAIIVLASTYIKLTKNNNSN